MISNIDYLFLMINVGQIAVSLFVVNQNSSIKINMQKLQLWIMNNFEPRTKTNVPGTVELPSLFDSGKQFRG